MRCRIFRSIRDLYLPVARSLSPTVITIIFVNVFNCPLGGGGGGREGRGGGRGRWAVTPSGELLSYSDLSSEYLTSFLTT